MAYFFLDKKVYVSSYIWIALYIGVILNVSFGLLEFFQYGDAGFLPWFVQTNAPFSRWLAGSALLGWSFPLCQIVTPNCTPLIWVKLSGSLCMIAASIFLLRRHPGRMALLLPIFTPVWLLYASGYDEYYPFIAGALLYTLTILHYRGSEYRPVWFALWVAILPLLYIGFAPLGLMLLLKYMCTMRSGRVLVCICSALFYFIGVQIFWPESAVHYLMNLPIDMNLGEKNTIYLPYVSQSLSNSSPFFAPSYALSKVHFLHLAYMQFWGGGWLAPLVLPFALIVFFLRCGETRIDVLKTNVFILAALLFQSLYFIFMIPKLGPVNDVDLFFSFYLTLAFFTGVVIDQSSARPECLKLIKYLFISAMAASSIALVFHMLLYDTALSTLSQWVS